MSNTQSNRGRNSELIQFRNRKLVARFYYYSVLLDLKFSRCLKNLVLEFDITESRIGDILSAYSDELTTLERQSVGVVELRKAYPFMAWQNPPAMWSHN